MAHRSSSGPESVLCCTYRLFFTTPKCFPQHVSSCRAVAISIPVARLRCSEQRITGVVNKLLPCTPPRVYCRLYCICPKPLSVHNSPSVTGPRREAVLAGSCHFAALVRKTSFSKCENGKNWHRRTEHLLAQQCWSAESRGRYTLR